MNATAKQSYFEAVDNLDLILKESGYKMAFIAKKLEIPISTFYLKKRQKSFTSQELRSIMNLIEIDEDPIYLTYEQK
ncbi:MAG: hypothetical protein LBT50_02980 [Prevotellaceae bacterium]|jgi:predicted transcriptional regulator|nr:hypothetical protein [Prevotellaceae bacterium]